MLSLLLLLFKIILCSMFSIVIIEGTTEIIVKSTLFEPIRAWLENKKGKVLKFLGSLIICPHCSSVWVSLLITTAVTFLFFISVFSISWYKLVTFLFLFSIFNHRLSNYLHMFIDRYIDKYYMK